MSSHHIIRDNQEPALVLFSRIDEELLRQLCGWSPLIYCSYSLLDWIQMLEIKIDFIFGPAELKETSLNQMAYQMPIKYFEIDDEGKLEVLIESIDNTTIQIVSEIDTINFPESEKTISFFNDEFKAYQFNGVWKKWKSKDEIISVEKYDPESISNLNAENNNLRVENNGIASFKTLAKAIVKEYH